MWIKNLRTGKFEIQLLSSDRQMNRQIDRHSVMCTVFKKPLSKNVNKYDSNRSANRNPAHQIIVNNYTKWLQTNRKRRLILKLR